ncbi:hypothetical protein GETHOR_08280 [Geothrix oryzae]|uniref:Uncharacterized protein n=1 Tax=Geothrix oryzae TaxID=2927975 RepID=A0ABM8DP18_9BACT|nr:hypothetical protein [Geothrix oryzae]BDU68727.1 hypothetical protein GETHOR_08280 [Geothrix oryzae]
MDLDELAAHLAHRQERQWTEAQERMARYRAYLDQVDTLFAQVQAWLQPLCDQGLLTFRRPLVLKDCVIRPEPIVGLEVDIGRFSLDFTPLRPGQAGLTGPKSARGPANPVFGVTLRPTHPSCWTLPEALTLVPEEGGGWRVSQSPVISGPTAFNDRFLAAFLAQCLEAADQGLRDGTAPSRRYS